MIKLNDVNTVYFDVDGTLVLYSDETTPEAFEERAISIPHKVNGTLVNSVVPHRKHIDLLKKFKQGGFVIVVWSQGGTDWCESVVKALQLEKYVDIVVNKPTWWIDDMNAGYFMPSSSRMWHADD